MKPRIILIANIFCIIIFSWKCKSDEICENCTSPRIVAEFENHFLRFVLTDPKPNTIGASYLVMDTISNLTTEFHACVTAAQGELEDKKIIRASGKIFRPCSDAELNFLKIDSYQIVDYCHPELRIIQGEFALENRWEVQSISTADTVQYVPCESYPLGAYLTIAQNSFIGYSGTNSFGGELIIKSPNQIQFKNLVVGLLTGTQAQIRFQNLFFSTLSTNTALLYTKQNNVLIIENPVNNYSITLFVP